MIPLKQQKHYKKVLCSICNGTGKDVISIPTYPPRLFQNVNCSNCNGVGYKIKQVKTIKLEKW